MITLKVTTIQDADDNVLSAEAAQEFIRGLI